MVATIIFQLLRHEIHRNDHNLLEKGHNIKMCTSDLQADFEHRSMVKVLIVIASFSYSVSEVEFVHPVSPGGSVKFLPAV